ncbi:MAG: glutamate--tRNA ligase [Patescibacteria group bacterium]
MIRTRFAPSPTGELHIGAARTALFEYLFAKSQDGEFFLRIEDTDRERYVEGATERIIDSLKWLGIKPDNLKNIMIQSERLETYKKHAFDLVRAGKAYICTCSKEKLAEDHEKQIKEKRPPKYEGYCRDANFKLEDMKEGCYTIRMKMPQSGKVVVNDLIRGKVEFDLSLMDDQILLKSDGYPTYHLASIVDDHEMEISHVIRAEEWLSSTPKHLILYEMLGWKAPEFAHLSMILGPDKKKLSKRHGATSIADYKGEGYLPEALVNFMVLLGWNPKDEREIFTLSELEKEFKIENVNKAPAIFNIEKLNSINSQYLKSQISNLKNSDQISKYLADFGVAELIPGEVELIGRGGYVTLRDAAEYILKLRKEPEYKAALLIFRKSDKEKTATALKVASEKLKTESKWDAESLQGVLESIVSDNNLTNGDVFWPVRVALSGEEKSPSPVELMFALGREESLKRIAKAVELIRSL